MTTASTSFRFIRTDAGARIVYAVLALTILVNPVAFVEPSPYEGMVLALAVVAFAFGLPIERRVLPLFLLLNIWAVSGFFALLPVFSDAKAVKYYEISVYLTVTAVLFACLFAENTVGRVRTLANAYIIAAVGVSLIAIAAYFRLIPNAESFIVNGRAAGTFKDPNVFAPYLILPLLILIQRTVYRGVRLTHLSAALVLLFALFLSFSRGAWGHFVFSAIVMVALLLLTEPSGRLKRRWVTTSVVAVAGVAMLLVVALSFSSVREMFTERAELLQSYDTGDRSGRFDRQQTAVSHVVDEPNGLGPMQFGRRYGGDIHNVYLSAFVAYGWAGGLAYLAIVFLTLKRGLGAILRSSPWRPFLVAVYATFVGVAAEGMIIDTDHWRHFFLLVGLIWGLSAAAAKKRAPPMAENAATGTTRHISSTAIEWSGAILAKTGSGNTRPSVIERFRKMPA